MSQTWWFHGIVLTAILVGFVCSLVDTYPAASGSKTLETLELFNFVVFLIEFIIKVLSDGLEPWRYCGKLVAKVLSVFVLYAQCIG